MYTIDEAIKHFKVKSREAIYMKVKRGQLERVVKGGITYYKTIDIEKSNIITKDYLDNAFSLFQSKIELLESEMKELNSKVEKLQNINSSLAGENRKLKEHIISSEETQIEEFSNLKNMIIELTKYNNKEPYDDNLIRDLTLDDFKGRIMDMVEVTNGKRYFQTKDKKYYRVLKNNSVKSVSFVTFTKAIKNRVNSPITPK